MSAIPAQLERHKPQLGLTAINALWPVAVAVVVGLVMFYGVGPWAGGYQTNVMLVIGINILLAVSLTAIPAP